MHILESTAWDWPVSAELLMTLFSQTGNHTTCRNNGILMLFIAEEGRSKLSRQDRDLKDGTTSTWMYLWLCYKYLGSHMENSQPWEWLQEKRRVILNKDRQQSINLLKELWLSDLERLPPWDRTKVVSVLVSVASCRLFCLLLPPNPNKKYSMYSQYPSR